MKRRLNLRIALIGLVLALVLIVPVYAQDATPEATATPEASATVEANGAAAAAATPEATAAVVLPATLEATAESTSEAAAISATPPETRPVAGVSEDTQGQASVPGATALVLLVGLGAVALVGFGALLRENYKPPQG